MNITAETNWDIELMEHLGRFPQVNEIFAVIQETAGATENPCFIIDDTQKKTVAEYIRKVHAAGLKFNCLFSGLGDNNMKFNKKIHANILTYIRWLLDNGVDSLTVTVPYFLEIIKTHFPSLEVRVSLIAQVNSVQRARLFEKLGADGITLDFNSNRDFKLLKQIRKAVSCRLSLIANDGCLYQCPYRYYHYNTLAQCTQSYHHTESFYIDYCILRCTIEKFSNPKEIIKSRWIRPEDIQHYEEIGIDTFKISGRRMSTKWLLNTINAYSGQKYDGNLFDILNCVAPGIEPEVISPQHKAFLEKAYSLNRENLDHVCQLYPLKPYIDNKALNGFIHFFKNQDCLSECEHCNYCGDLAMKAVDIESLEPAKYIGSLMEVLNDFTHGRIFEDFHTDNVNPWEQHIPGINNL